MGGIFAIVILVCLVLIPMLFIQLYPLKLFHKLLDALHLRKQVLISLGDIFTGSYKNGSDSSFDGRYFAGFYFLLKLIILVTYSVHSHNYGSLYQIILYAIFGGMIMIFRPYIKNINNFNEYIILILMIISNVPLIINTYYEHNRFSPFVFQFSIHNYLKESLNYQILVGGIILSTSICYLTLLILTVYVIVKMVMKFCLYCKSTRESTHSPINIDDINEDHPLLDNNEFADRIENPDDYDEHHVQHAPYAHYAINVHTSSYGTIN
jgi:hypothetical protein